MTRNFLSVSIDKQYVYVSANELQIGQIGVTKDGRILLRTYTNVTDLSDPQTTWSNSCHAPDVRILPAGSTLKLTVI
jgi:hypothetical protein